MVMTIGDKLTRIRITKKIIREIVNQKGGNISSSMPFEEYPEAIAAIPQVAGSSGVPPGAIIAWYGDAENVPTGWALCDGENGTPDLRGRFLLGVSENHELGSEGGEETRTLISLNVPRHAHGEYIAVDDNGTISKKSLGVSSSTGAVGYAIKASSITTISSASGVKTNPTVVQVNENAVPNPPNSFGIMPPYFALHYIMKLPDEVTES